MRVVVCETRKRWGEGKGGIVTNDEVGDPNAPTDEWMGRAGGGEGGAKLRENKTAAKAEESKVT